MSTIAARPVEQIAAPPAQYGARGFFELDGASWELYEKLLDETAHQNIRITYDQGRMVLMSPLPRHELVKKLVARLIELASLEMDVPIRSLGSTTWKRKDIRKGLEADECYYIQNEARVRGKLEFDLRRDPPPDLAVEVDISYNPLDRPSIYASLGVPEIWRFHDEAFAFLRRQDDGTYGSDPRSKALPFLTAQDVNHFVAMLGTTDENSIMRSFRDWLRSLPK